MKQLRKDHNEIEATFMRELRADGSPEAVGKANKKYSTALDAWRKKALTALRESGNQPEAFEVIAAFLSGADTNTPELVTILRTHHTARPDLGKLFHSLVQSRGKEGPAFIEEIVEKSPVAAVRGQAAYEIGWQAKWRITQDGKESFGFGKKLTEEERKRWQARAEKYLTLAAEKYTSVPPVDEVGTVGANARAELAGLKNLPNLRVGKVAPDIEGEGLDGKKFKLGDTRGKVTVVVFWASWCGPCMRMVPHEKKLVEWHKGQPFALIGVNGDEELDKAQEAAKKAGMTWPSFRAEADRTAGPIHRAWNVHVWPTIYVLDADGVIRYTGHEDEKLDDWVDQLLAEMGKK